MTYERPEALEVGAAAEVILGAKDPDEPLDTELQRPKSLVIDEIE